MSKTFKLEGNDLFEEYSGVGLDYFKYILFMRQKLFYYTWDVT